MSRKAAYALKGRDPAFCAVWIAAVKAASASFQGDKVEEVEGAPVPRRHGNASPTRMDRERAFTRFVAALRESPPLARRAPAQ
jgi:hypothetical protein